MNGICFGWGPGEGHRLLAPGLPDVLFSDGKALGWQSREGLFIWSDAGIWLFPFGEIGNITAAVSGWLVQSKVDSEWHITRIDPQSGSAETLVCSERNVSAGTSWAVLDDGLERSVLDLKTGAPVRIPVGARDARPMPWPDSPGLLWLDGTSVYRLGAALKPRLAGSLPAKPIEWKVGPSGSAVFKLPDATWCVSATGSPVETIPVDLDTIRFDPLGTSALATGDGVAVYFDLQDGQVLDTLQGHFSSIGFSPEPILLDEDSGLVRTWSGQGKAGGFAPSAAIRVGQKLFGPGGTAWDLEAGQRLWDESPLEGTHLAVCGELIASVAQRVELFDHEGTRRGNFSVPVDEDLDGPLFDVVGTPEGDLFFEIEDGWVRVDHNGRRLGNLHERDEATSDNLESGNWRIDIDAGVITERDGTRHWPIVADGIAHIGDTLWCWSEDGLLCALDLSQ